MSTIFYNPILLTGASGFLGKSLLKSFKTELVITLGRKNSDINSDLVNMCSYIPPVDLVIHAAGKAHTIPKNDLEEKLFFDVNVNGTKNLLECLEKSKSVPKSFIFISSVSVYGLDFGININENTLLNAKDTYGKSKIQAENLVTRWCEDNNVICTILRLPLLVGSNPPGNLSSMISAIKKGYYFNISNGNAKKSMILVDDIGKIILKVANIGGVFNLTDGYHPTFLELSKHISIQLGKKTVYKMPYIFAKCIAKFGDLIGNRFPFNSNKLNKIVSTLTFDDSKARKEFNWEPTLVLKGFKIHE